MMELAVFDLDGTLLNAQQQLSGYTRETLLRMQHEKIPYTLATGRTLHAAQDCIAGAHFPLLHVYNNGVVIWCPESTSYKHHNSLSSTDIEIVLNAFAKQPISPFIFAVEPNGEHSVYMGELVTDNCKFYGNKFDARDGLLVKPLEELHSGAKITNINALGHEDVVSELCTQIRKAPNLVVYTGGDMYSNGYHWLDIHQHNASKGDAIQTLKDTLGFEKVLCFGDSDNDYSMFQMADEAYATANALDELKAMASGVIGHHDEDGVARYLRKRYGL
ncbi:HAD family phosphatase [Leucothrix sargassi]|nr:HAD family phosphatase [Leucothrix sargassi]